MLTVNAKIGLLTIAGVIIAGGLTANQYVLQKEIQVKNEPVTIVKEVAIQPTETPTATPTATLTPVRHVVLVTPTKAIK